MIFNIKIMRVCVIGMICFCFLGTGTMSFSQNPAKTSTKEEEALAKGISKKMDKTIKVLNVIKGELDDYQQDVEKEEAKTPKTAEEEGAGWGAKIGRMIKAWRKARKAIDEETESPQDITKEKEEEKVWTEDVKNKVDKTIGALEAIRKELDQIEESDK